MGKHETPERRQVYFVGAETLGLIKIGMATDAPARLRDLQGASPDILAIEATVRTSDARRLETHFHNRFNRDWSHREWFRPNLELGRLISALAVTDKCGEVEVIYSGRYDDPRVIIPARPEETAEGLASRVCDILESLGFEVDRTDYDEGTSPTPPAQLL